MKKKLKFISVNLFIVIACFFLMELAVRLFVKEAQPQTVSGDLFEDFRYSESPGLKPGAIGKAFGTMVNVNEFGFRKTKTKPSAQKKSWLHLGDSVAMGVGVDDDKTFSALFDEQRKDINILNASVAGFGTSDYVNVVGSLLSDSTDEWNFERVSIFYCLNDIYSGRPGQIGEGMDEKKFFSITSFFQNNFRFYVFLKAALLDRQKVFFEYDGQFYHPEDEHFLNAMNDIRKINTICQNYGVDFDIWVMPYEYQMREEYSSDSTPQEVIRSVLEETDISVHIPTFSSDYKGREFYLFGDGIHFSDLGHEMICESLVENYN